MKTELVLGPAGLQLVPTKVIDAMINGLQVVPWPVVDGHRVTTNGYTEIALGLTPLIAGWCEQGFYVDPTVGAQPLLDHIANIDWHKLAKRGSFYSTVTKTTAQRYMLPGKTLPAWAGPFRKETK